MTEQNKIVSLAEYKRKIETQERNNNSPKISAQEIDLDEFKAQYLDELEDMFINILDTLENCNIYPKNPSEYNPEIHMINTVIPLMQNNYEIEITENIKK